MKTIHDRTIEQIHRLYPEAKRKGFRTALRALSDKYHFEEMQLPFLIPDLWFIDEECMSVVCIEVEDFHPISARKMGKYDAIWWWLDSDYWEMHLIVADRWGDLKAVSIPEYGLMGQTDETRSDFGNWLTVEKQKNLEVLKLTRAYATKDGEERQRARLEWMEKHPRYVLSDYLGRNPGLYVLDEELTH